MHALTTEARQALTDMVVQIVEVRGNKLSHLSLESFSYDDRESAEQGEAIMEAILNSDVNLIALNMAQNKEWWNREECRQLFPAVLLKQNRLRELNLDFSQLTAEYTESLLTQIAARDDFCSQLTTLSLKECLNFANDAAVERFADILEKGLKLDYCFFID